MLICIKLYSPKANKEGSFVKVMVFGLPDLRVKRLSWKVHSAKRLQIQHCVSPKFGCHRHVVSSVYTVGTYHQFDLQRASPAIRLQPNSCTDYIGAN